MIGWVAGKLLGKVAAPGLATALGWAVLALGLSLAGNAWQFYRAAYDDGVQATQADAAKRVEDAAVKLSETIGETEALRETAAKTIEVAATAAQQQADLTQKWIEIADHGNRARKQYEQTVTALGEALCPPGAARQAAFNQAMRE